MNAAETSASSAIAPWTPLTVVWRSLTTAEIDTFISDVSTTRTNIAIASSSDSRELPDSSAGASMAAAVVMRPRLGERLALDRVELDLRDRAGVEQLLGLRDLLGGAPSLG